MAVDHLQEPIAVETRLEGACRYIEREELDHVMMRRVPRRAARPRITGRTARIFAFADVLYLAIAFAFRERFACRRDVVGDPMHRAHAAQAVGVDHDQRKTLGAGRRIRPGERRRDALTGSAAAAIVA